MTNNKEAIERMDRSLSVMITLFIQFFYDKFSDEETADDTVDAFINNLVDAYCDLLDDQDHHDVMMEKLDEVASMWINIRSNDEENEHPAD